jgi:transposase-like protein
MKRRKFTREFKLEAVRLIKDRGVSYVQASQDHKRGTICRRTADERDEFAPPHAGHGPSSRRSPYRS